MKLLGFWAFFNGAWCLEGRVSLEHQNLWMLYFERVVLVIYIKSRKAVAFKVSSFLVLITAA